MANNLLQIDASIAQNGDIVLNVKVENLSVPQVSKILGKIKDLSEKKTLIEKSSIAIRIPRED